MFFLYTLLMAFVLAPYFLLRGLQRGKLYYRTLPQRLGWIGDSMEQTDRPTIWLHAVSVGEVLSCEELVAAVRRRLPRARIVVSTTTTTGQNIAREKLAPVADAFFYAPLDLPSAVRRTLRHVRPRLVIVAETEIWPNLFREVKRTGATLLLVNARISDRSAPRYRMGRFFFRRVLALPDAILAQSALDRQRLIEAGAPPEKVDVGGNLKFDFRAEAVQPPPEIQAVIERAKPRAVILAGSTRETEEEQVLDAFRLVAEKQPSSLLILAPRHPERFEAVAELLAVSGLPFVRRSQLGRHPTPLLPGVLLLDTLGELASLYRLADVVFIGGSLVDWGGHNVLEPAFAGRAVVVGPHMQNFRAITDALLGARAMLQVGDADKLGPAIVRLLESEDERTELGERARRVAESHRGATERAAACADDLVQRAVPDRVPGALERLALWGPARLWDAGVRIRNARYDHGRRPMRRLATPVISVGNITAGGTGKTPMVLWLIEQLQARQLGCAVLTRGYRRDSPEKTLVLEPGAATSPLETGDEAQLVLRRFRIPMGIAADRYQVGREIVERFHPDVVVLDDGFQHRRLARDLDLVLIDVTAPFGRRELLPLGRLREPLASLGRAGAFVLTRAEPWERWDGLIDELRRWNPRAPVYFARLEPECFIEAASGQVHEPAALQVRPSLAFCGVANPDSFWTDLERIGVPVVERAAFADHHRYSPAEVRDLVTASRRHGAEALVTTEKDAVNLPYPPPSLFWLKTRMVVDRGDDLLRLILDRVSQASGERVVLGR